MTSVDWVDRSLVWSGRAGGASLLGNFRENNEDYVHIDSEYPFALVLDGMGGLAAGEIASRTAAEAVQHALRRGLKAGDEPRELIENAVRGAHEQLRELGQLDRDLRNMGTTIVLALLHGDRVYVSWVGDSPAYRVSGGRVEKLTWEHDMRTALVRAGVISAEEAHDHHIRNALWRYLGSPDALERLEIPSFVPCAGDRLLLATDGVTGVLTDADLLEMCQLHLEPQACAEELVNLALGRGSRDNCTCAVLAFEWSGDGPAPERPQPPQPAPRKWWRFWK